MSKKMESRPRRILVVDDEETVRTVVAASLRRAGFDVTEARDGLDAMNVSRRLQPDVIVTDLNMPRCDGQRLCEELKRDLATARIPVVVMTGSAPDETHLRKLGCVAFLHKPVTRSVADCVRDVLTQPAPGASRSGTGRCYDVERAHRRVGPPARRHPSAEAHDSGGNLPGF
jgi:two-component system, chemotaxis family, chemotaxis protein CheY